MRRSEGAAILAKLLKDELGGLREAFESLLAADRDKTAALEAHHVAYAAAAQRAELAEHRAERADGNVARLEGLLVDARSAVLVRPAGVHVDPEVAA